MLAVGRYQCRRIPFGFRPSVIEAVQFDGANGDAILDWAGSSSIERRVLDSSEMDDSVVRVIPQPGDWVVRLSDGSFGHYTDEDFRTTYEPAWDSPPASMTEYSADCDPSVWRAAAPFVEGKDHHLVRAIADGVERDGVHVVDHGSYKYTFRRARGIS